MNDLLVLDNKHRAYIAIGSRTAKNGQSVYDCMTIDAHPQQRVLEEKNIRYCLPLFPFVREGDDTE